MFQLDGGGAEGSVLAQDADLPAGSVVRGRGGPRPHGQAPLVWNSLPLEVRLSASSSSFQSQLKTHLFRICLPMRFFAAVDVVCISMSNVNCMSVESE